MGQPGPEQENAQVYRRALMEDGEKPPVAATDEVADFMMCVGQQEPPDFQPDPPDFQPDIARL